MGLALERTHRPRAGAARCSLVSLAFNLGVLGFFKYGNFFADDARSAARRRAGRRRGTSSCRSASRSTRSSRSATRSTSTAASARRASLLDFALFVSFFPHLVAGPIVRPRASCRSSTRRRRFAEPRRRGRARAHRAGLLQEGRCARTCSGDTSTRCGATSTLYPAAERRARVLRLRVPDLLRLLRATPTSRSASARLFGLTLPENFARPYLAQNPREFWQRWHISLSTWLRDYLYIPLGGNRGARVADVREPARHHAARRPLARRGLDVRPLGRVPRRCCSRCTAMLASRRPARGARVARPRARDRRHVPPRRARLGALPRAVVRRTRSSAIAASRRVGWEWTRAATAGGDRPRCHRRPAASARRRAQRRAATVRRPVAGRAGHGLCVAVTIAAFLLAPESERFIYFQF